MRAKCEFSGDASVQQLKLLDEFFAIVATSAERITTGRVPEENSQAFDSNFEFSIFEFLTTHASCLELAMGPRRDAQKMRPNRSVDSDFTRKKARQFATFLRALKDAQEYAQDLKCSIWDFAISPAKIGELDVHINDLRWMIRKGWIQHNRESSLTPDCPPDVGSDETLIIRPSSSFIIRQGGIDALAGCSDPDGCIRADDQIDDDVPTLIKPSWDAERHELSFVGQIVKRFRWPAANQETILMAFEEESWPSHIYDPLPQVSDVDPKRRLSDSIKCLNRNQRADLVRFRGDGTGQGVFWDARLDL